MQVPAADVSRKCAITDLRKNIQNNAAEPKAIRGDCTQELVLRLHGLELAMRAGGQRRAINRRTMNFPRKTPSTAHDQTLGQEMRSGPTVET